MLCSTVREILAGTEEKYGPKDAIRYKVSKNEIASKTYTQLKEDSESFSCAFSLSDSTSTSFSPKSMAVPIPRLVMMFPSCTTGALTSTAPESFSSKEG